MAHEDVGVPDFLEGPKLFRDFIGRSRDQGFCRNAAIASAQRVLQHRLCLARRPADVNVAPQGDGVWLPAVRGAALTIDIGLNAGLLEGKAGARDPALRQSCRAVDGRRCAGTDPDLDGLSRTQRKARFGRSGTAGRNSRFHPPAGRIISRASSKAEGRVLMLTPMAANRASPQPSPHCMMKGP